VLHPHCRDAIGEVGVVEPTVKYVPVHANGLGNRNLGLSGG
jgi:hypothetical protein